MGVRNWLIGELDNWWLVLFILPFWPIMESASRGKDKGRLKTSLYTLYSYVFGATRYLEALPNS